MAKLTRPLTRRLTGRLATGLQLSSPEGVGYLGKTSLGSRIRQGMNSGALAGFSGYSWHMVQELPSAFTAVRLVFFNVTALAIPIDRAIVGQTNSLVGGNQLVPTGSGAAWVNVTFDGGSLSGSIPANANGDAAANPTYYFSDWIPLASIARADGGTFPALMARCYLSTANPLPNLSTGTSPRTAWQTSAADLLWMNYHFKSGDFVSTNTAGFTGTSDPGQIPIVGIQYQSATAGLSVVGHGDSNTRGEKATADGNSWFNRACTQITTDGKLIFPQNFGWGGQSIDQYYARWQKWLAQGQIPAVAVFQGGTSNGWYDGASTNAKAKITAFLADCALNRIRPVVVTMLPKNSYTLGEDNDRKLLNNWIRALASDRIKIVDADAVVSDGASPAKFIVGTVHADGTHLVDAGHALVKPLLIDVLLPLAA